MDQSMQCNLARCWCYSFHSQVHWELSFNIANFTNDWSSWLLWVHTSLLLPSPAMPAKNLQNCELIRLTGVCRYTPELQAIVHAQRELDNVWKSQLSLCWMEKVGWAKWRQEVNMNCWIPIGFNSVSTSAFTRRCAPGEQLTKLYTFGQLDEFSWSWEKNKRVPCKLD